MFGFMQHSHDHGSYIGSLDALLPILATAAASGPVTRFFVLGSSMISSATRKALEALDALPNAARQSVKERRERESKAQSKPSKRIDLLQHLLDIVQEKGEKMDFGMGEVEKEAYVAL